MTTSISEATSCDTPRKSSLYDATSFRVIPEEEREAKYNRLVSSTLLSFGYVMEVLQKDDMADVSEHCENIFREKKFWKYSKHKAPMVNN